MGMKSDYSGFDGDSLKLSSGSTSSDMTASRFSTRPLYLQVRDLLMHRISTRQWASGSAIPNEMQLAQELDVSVGTVRKALNELERERLIDRQQGRGTFVSNPTSGDMVLRFTNIRTRSGRAVNETISTIGFDRDAASREEAQALQMPATSEVWRTVRVRYEGKRAFMKETTSLPVRRFPFMSLKDSESKICVSAQTNNVLLKDAREVVSTGVANDDDASILAVTPGSPLLVLERVIFDIDGRPAEFRVVRCNLGDLQYVTHLH